MEFVESNFIPYLATGYNKLPALMKELVDMNSDGDLSINNFDESVKTKNLFFIWNRNDSFLGYFWSNVYFHVRYW